MILSKQKDLRLTTIRRGGTLTDVDHHRLALYAADCAAHVLSIFEASHPADERPREAIELARSWGRGEIGMREARQGAFAGAAARDTSGAARFMALSAAQAVVVSHVAAHYLGAAAYAIRAAQAAASDGDKEPARLRERDWQRAQLPADLRALVLDDQKRRNAICWSVFD